MPWSTMLVGGVAGVVLGMCGTLGVLWEVAGGRGRALCTRPGMVGRGSLR